MPVAVVIASPKQIGLAALVVSLVCACAVLRYSLYKARRGDWAHVDASVPAERAQFNVRIGIGLLLAAGGLWLAGLHVGFPLVVGLSGLIVAVGHLLRHVAKLSLHVAFAVFAAVLVWPNYTAAVALALVAAGVAWSRLALRRHVPADIILGWLAGAVAGLALHIAVARLAA
jgi:membrane-associated phospholipid phosphatase